MEAVGEARVRDFRTVDVDQMQRIELDIATVIAKYRHNTEVAIIVFALVRVVRVLLSKYSDAFRTMLLKMVFQFLQQPEAARNDPAARLLLQ